MSLTIEDLRFTPQSTVNNIDMQKYNGLKDVQLESTEEYLFGTNENGTQTKAISTLLLTKLETVIRSIQEELLSFNNKHLNPPLEELTLESNSEPSLSSMTGYMYWEQEY